MKRLAVSLTIAASALLLAAPALADVVQGTNGPDSLHGTSGPDRIYGHTSADSIRSGLGRDRIYGGFGADFLMDGGGNDLAVGGPGRDHFNVRRGADVIHGRSGNDYVLLYHDGYRDTVGCGAGNDLVQYTGTLERHDSFEGCERVEAYTP